MRLVRQRAAWVLVLAAALGCSDSPTNRVFDPGSPLRLELHAENEDGDRVTRFDSGENVWFVLEITNLTADPVLVRFRTRRVFDFIVGADGNPTLWVWSQGRLFQSTFTTLTFEAGRTETVRVEWDQRRNDGGVVGRGSFRAWGLLPAETGEIQSAPLGFRID